MKTWSTSKLDKLANAFLGLDKKKDMGKFLRDLCTLEELEEMSSRWEVVEFLHKGLSYRDVSKKTGVSTATITRIAFWLKNGEGGYLAALEKQNGK